MKERHWSHVLKKTIEYEDFNGEKVSEDFYFHISKAELIELEMSHQGGLSEWLMNIVAAEDGKTIIAEFKKILLSAYGQRSPDGRRFIKNQELRDEFEQTEAYSVLFVELVTNTDSAIEFVNGVMPKELVEEASKQAAKIAENKELVVDSEKLVVDSEKKTYTKVEVEEMSPEEFEKLGPLISSGEVRIVD